MDKKNTYTTGYFGRASQRPGGDARTTQVHILRNGKCLCGYKPHKTMLFHWNSSNINLDYAECPTCVSKGRNILNLPTIDITSPTPILQFIHYLGKKILFLDHNNNWKQKKMIGINIADKTITVVVFSEIKSTVTYPLIHKGRLRFKIK